MWRRNLRVIALAITHAVFLFGIIASIVRDQTIPLEMIATLGLITSFYIWQEKAEKGEAEEGKKSTKEIEKGDDEA